MKEKRVSYIVWKGYQRRAEVLAPLLKANLEFMPHKFRSKYLRPIDYFLKTIATIRHISKYRPNLVVFQAPPLIVAIPAILLGVEYVIDAHNAVVQGFWHKLPLSRYIIEHASAVIVHNSEILELAKTLFPNTKFVGLQDPLQHIFKRSSQRLNDQILVICSFGSDEPVDVIIESITKLPNYKFIITADISKLQEYQQQRLYKCQNVRLTGFLPTDDYHALLCTSTAALVLTTRDANQPSGACEALSSDTQLIVSDSTLTRKMFADWAIFVDNTVESIVCAIQTLEARSVNLSHYRDEWNTSVQAGVEKLYSHLL